jgi:uncharacterized membrane protein YhdT
MVVDRRMTTTDQAHRVTQVAVDPDQEWSPRAVTAGLASGLLILTVFAACWALAGLGVAGVEGLPRWFGLSCILVISVALALTGIQLLAAARQLLPDSSSESAERGRRVGMQFGLVFGAEFVLIAIASRVLASVGRDSLIIPVIAVIVGAHFLPLAGLFHVRTYYATGGTLAAIGLAGVIGVLTTSAHAPWQAGVAYGAALVLWITSAAIARRGRQLVRSAATR